MPIHRRFATIAPALGIVMLLAAPASAAEEPSSDCGATSLYLFAHLAGRPSDLETIRRILGPAPAPGYSMAEIRDAARELGLDLVGVRLSKTDRSLDGPAIVFVKRGDRGHYCAMRPVGFTGRLVQVLDPSSDPEVLDAKDLDATTGWTGLALVARPKSWTSLGFGSAAVIAGSILAIRSQSRRGSPAKRTQSAPASSG